ncbi:MAG: hypothetical protein GKR98_07955 [Boseongicola sp.]|nr:MAG: hypothetical protein GKR98_07955 [Boseongicola sp.]
MQNLFHLGAHCTDDGLLIKSILRNRGPLSSEGILVPGPGRYRELLGDASTTLRGEPASEDTEAMLMEVVCDDDSADRIILSSENFLCRSKVALGADGLYPKAAKSAWLRNCFPNHDVEFAIAIRNPALLVPDILAGLNDVEQQETLTELSPFTLRWSDVVADILEANPDTRLTVWCHEDAPYIWSEILRELTAHDPYTTLEGAYDMAEAMMTPVGVDRLKSFVEGHSDLTESRRRKAIAAFLEAHVREKAEDTTPDTPLLDWSDKLCTDLTAYYDEDVTRIAALPRVTFIEP